MNIFYQYDTCQSFSFFKSVLKNSRLFLNEKYKVKKIEKKFFHNKNTVSIGPSPGIDLNSVKNGQNNLRSNNGIWYIGQHIK